MDMHGSYDRNVLHHGLNWVVGWVIDGWTMGGLMRRYINQSILQDHT